LQGWDIVTSDRDIVEMQDDIIRADGLLVIYLSSTVEDLFLRLVNFDVPIVLYAKPYAGHVWSLSGELKKRGKKVLVVATEDLSELVDRLKLLEVIGKLRKTRVLLFRDKYAGFYSWFSSPSYMRTLRDKYGLTVVWRSSKDIRDAYDSISDKEAGKLAKEVIDKAEGVKEPSMNDIVKACRLYLALKSLIEKEKVHAITIDCFGMLADGTIPNVIPTTPCLAFSLLNDEGIPAACEADLDSLLTMLIFKYLCNKPSFISDPVIDTKRGVIAHAHCTAATRMAGYGARPEPFILRSHSESKKYVSLQVRMSVGQVVTVAKLNVALGKLYASTGEIIGNPDIEWGCRTKFEAKVANAERFLEDFSGGLHRVVVYGDYSRELEWLSRLLGMEFAREI